MRDAGTVSYPPMQPLDVQWSSEFDLGSWQSEPDLGQFENPQRWRHLETSQFSYPAYDTAIRPPSFFHQLIAFALSRLLRRRPSPFNVVSRLQGKVPERAEHNLSCDELRGYAKEFRELAERITRFNRNIRQRRVPTRSSLEQQLSPPIDPLKVYPQPQPKSGRKDTEPSD